MKESKQSRKITIFAIILSLVSIGILVFGFLLVSSDKVVMMQSISNLYNKLDKDLEKDSNLLNKISVSDKIGIKANITTKVDDVNTNIKLDYLENKDDKKSNLSVVVSDDSSELLDTNFVLDKDKLFMFIKDITPMYYTMDMNYISFIRSLSSDDVDSLLSILKDSLNSSISKKDIKKEKVTIKYKNKDKKVSKLTYTVTNNEFRQIYSKFIKTLKKDKKLLGSVSDYFDLSKKELTKVLDKYLKEIPKDDKKLFSYSTYYYGFNKIVEYDFDFYEKDISIKYKDENDIDNLTISSELGTVILKIENNGNTKKFSGTYIPSVDDNLEIKFNGSYDGKKFILNVDNEEHDKLVINIKHDNTTDNYKYNYNITLYSLDNIVLNMKVDLELYFDEDVVSIEQESKDISELTEEEQEILNNIFDDFSIENILLRNEVEEES